MPTYLNTISRGSQNFDFKERQSSQTNCRQVYEHVQDCPVCQQLFLGLGSIEKSNPMMMTPRFAAGNTIEISPTVGFLGIVLLVILVAFVMKRLG
jgi:predicted anti-sigma-YlaC factor YlaD